MMMNNKNNFTLNNNFLKNNKSNYNKLNSK